MRMSINYSSVLQLRSTVSNYAFSAVVVILTCAINNNRITIESLQRVGDAREEVARVCGRTCWCYALAIDTVFLTKHLISHRCALIDMVHSWLLKISSPLRLAGCSHMRNDEMIFFLLFNE